MNTTQISSKAFLAISLIEMEHNQGRYVAMRRAEKLGVLRLFLLASCLHKQEKALSLSFVA